MRAFYATEKHIRAFVLGTPEGWHVAVYDLQNGYWAEMSNDFCKVLKDAKSDAHQRTEALLGKRIPNLKWH